MPTPEQDAVPRDSPGAMKARRNAPRPRFEFAIGQPVAQVSGDEVRKRRPLGLVFEVPSPHTRQRLACEEVEILAGTRG
jgi:hypothetical protein